MGVWLKFHIADPAAVARAVEDIDLEFFDDPQQVTASADFSLHITPRDLDLLSAEAGKLLKGNPVLLTDTFEQCLIDEMDRGAFHVGSAWVQQMAALDRSDASRLTALWFASMRDEYANSEILATPEAEAAVRDLITLCQSALRMQNQVVHVWFA